MVLTLSFSSLLISVVLLQLSSGILGPLDVLSGFELGFTTTQVGLLGSAHFIGFFVGCWMGPGLVSQIGHSRAFAVFAAMGTVGILLHMVIINPYAWACMRILAGLCVAGCFTVMEGWIQAKSENQTRGRSLRTYRTADMVGGIVAQTLIAWLPHGNYIAYNLIAIICVSSLLPLALTRIPAPKTSPHLQFHPLLAFHTSIMATVGVITAGVTSAGFRMVGPIFGTRINLSDLEMGLFLGSFLVGGALAQYPIGWIADKIDRRRVLIYLSVAAIFACLFILVFVGMNALMLMIGTIFFGFCTYPIYSVSAAHANDFIKPEKIIELNASLLFFFGVGAIISPLLMSALIDWFGYLSMFAFVAIIHLFLLIFGIFRIKVGQTPDKKTKYVFTPRTSWAIGGLLRKYHNRNHD